VTEASASRAYLRLVLAAGTHAEGAWQAARLLDEVALVRLDLLSDADVGRIGRELGRLIVSVEADNGLQPVAEGQPTS
jgi:hypothetical protein